MLTRGEGTNRSEADHEEDSKTSKGTKFEVSALRIPYNLPMTIYPCLRYWDPSGAILPSTSELSWPKEWSII
jgi:hypothetical protein